MIAEERTHPALIAVETMHETNSVNGSSAVHATLTDFPGGFNRRVRRDHGDVQSRRADFKPARR